MKKQTPHKPLPKSVKWLWGIVFAPFALLLLLLLLTAAGLFGRLPSFEELENPKSNLATEILSSDGKVLGTFFVQNRSYVQYDELFPLDSAQLLRLDGYDVPPIIAALISTEDVRYRGHSGIDLISLVRVGVKTVLMQNTSQGGGSTITSPLGSRAHSTLPVLFSVFLISLPIFSGLFCGAYACRMRAINSPCWANRSYIGCTAARNLAFSSSSSSVTSMPAARRSLSDSASCCAQSLRSTLALSRAHRRMISG